MFDFMLKKIQGGRILIRNVKTGEFINIRATELPKFFLEEFSDAVEEANNEQQMILDLQETINKRGF